MDQQGRLDNPWSIYNILDSWFGERLNADTISRINGMPTGHWESLWEYANSNPPFSPITLLAPGELRPYVPAMTKHDYKKEGEQRQVSFSSNRQLSARFVRSIKTCALYSHSISVSGRLDWLGPPDRPNLRSDAVTAQQISVASAQAKEVWRQSARKALGALLEIRSLVEAGIVVLDTEWRDRDDLIDRELLASLPKNFIAIPEGSSTSGADDGYDGIRIPDLRMIFDLHMVAARLDGATAGRAHLLFETRELESAFRELLRLGILRSGAGVGADLGHQPGGRLFSLLHQFEIPDLSGLSCADLARARATEGASRRGVLILPQRLPLSNNL